MNTEPWNPKFIKYSSIEGNKASIIKNIQKAEIANCDWIVCEKVHGANFSFITNGTEIVCSRRKGLLQPDERFYNFQAVREKYREAVIQCWEVVRGRGLIEADASLTIYGELFGGIYRHPSIVNDNDSGNEPPVQTEVQYCPHRDFLAFDILSEDVGYFDMDVMWSVLEEAGVPYIKPLMTGCTFEEALAFNPKFQTTVPALFGLPDIKCNFAEGVVIRPIKTLRVTRIRVILKLKYGGFMEKKPKTAKKIQKEDNSMAPVNVVLEQLKGFVNENRLVSVLSKEGELTEENKSEIMKLLVDDAMEDYKKEEDLWKTFDDLTEREQITVTKMLRRAAMEVIREHLKAE
ncbi:hypothetical protein BC937DRAFT_89812 [Endogone sp. FLAS-F59071]|nr:hypothetical protein BC937DRAFT_89812 [Endogone sp. FLAS-F59071]|eukprot:RUS17558.1 hypothetical protein BC937DRAFT_89812 [Endogone sp. FLAS-F59071]